jgi:hypothetical protein
MNKPDWKDAPEWARWLAMDGDGSWWWYEQKPRWIKLTSQWWRKAGSHKTFAIEGVGPKPYGTLEQRP